MAFLSVSRFIFYPAIEMQAPPPSAQLLEYCPACTGHTMTLCRRYKSVGKVTPALALTFSRIYVGQFPCAEPRNVLSSASGGAFNSVTLMDMPGAEMETHFFYRTSVICCNLQTLKSLQSLHNLLLLKLNYVLKGDHPDKQQQQ